MLSEWNDEDGDGLAGMLEPTARFSQLPLAFFLYEFVSKRQSIVRTERETALWTRVMTPAAVAIVTSAPVTITSSYRDEILYAAGGVYKHDADRRSVFCWRDPGWEHDRDKEQWTLVPVDNRCDRFCIASKTFDVYLYATNYAKKHHGLTRVFLWPRKSLADPMGVWVLVPLHLQPNGKASDAVDEFALYNPHAKRFLFSTDHCKDDSRRCAFAGGHVPNAFPRANERKWTLAPALPKQKIEAN